VSVSGLLGGCSPDGGLALVRADLRDGFVAVRRAVARMHFPLVARHDMTIVPVSR
jgi:hypothetical protein